MVELSEISESIIKGSITGEEGDTKAAIAAGVLAFVTNKKNLPSP